MFFSKRMKKMNEGLDKAKLYGVAEAIKILKEKSAVKFDESLDIAINLGIDTKQSDQNVRGMVSLPHGTGKKVRVAVFAKGLMPNPKLGTVTIDVKGAVEKAKAGQVEFRAEKAGVVHAGLGKLSFDAKKLEENAAAFIDAIAKAKPASSKGVYIKKIVLSSTQGVGLRIDPASAK